MSKKVRLEAKEQERAFSPSSDGPEGAPAEEGHCLGIGRRARERNERQCQGGQRQISFAFCVFSDLGTLLLTLVTLQN